MKRLENLGFAEIQTGGGCTALAKPYCGGHLLVTNNDAMAPEKTDRLFALWREDENGEVIEKETDGFYSSDRLFARIAFYEKAEKLAREFAKVVETAADLGNLDGVSFQQILERNRADAPGVCSLHDVCDANMLMHEAWMNLFAPKEPDVSKNADSELWDIAWSVAKQTDFFTKEEPVTGADNSLPPRCTYPACKCIVSTSTSQPVPVCPLGLPKGLEDKAQQEFDAAWDALEEQGKCDSRGGMEYLRVLEEWAGYCRPMTVAQFIEASANILPDETVTAAAKRLGIH